MDFKALKADQAAAAADAEARGVPASQVHQTVALYDDFCTLTASADAARSQKNLLSKEMGKLRSKKNGEPDMNAIAEVTDKSKAVKMELATLEKDLRDAEEAMHTLAASVPNRTHPAVPVGPEENAIIVKTEGVLPEFSFVPKGHVDLALDLDIVDFKAAAVGSGRSFYYLKGDGAMLELALVNYAMSKLIPRGFTPILTPDVVKEDVLEKCGFQPRGEETQVYALDQKHADGDGGMLCLAGTAEVPLAALNMNQTLQASTLPMKLAGVSHCFRAEAGGAGSNSRGLYRVHQFTKVEMFAITEGNVEESDAMLESLLELQQEMYKELGLHYRVLDMPTLELGAPAYRKYDIEAWMPGRGTFGEVSSASNCTDYQSRRLNTRYSHKAGGGGSKHAHTLNGTAIAVPRIIVALLETGQQEDGSVLLPKVLAPFFGGRRLIPLPAKN